VTNRLYYGDNLDVLRNAIASESVDLIYLDPPFNSNANYNILFKSKTGDGADAQIEAFEDSWHWNDHAEDAFDQVIRSGNTDAAELLRAMRTFLGENDMMAYHRDDGGAAAGTTPRAEGDGELVPALRPHGVALFEAAAGWGVWCSELRQRDRLEAQRFKE
jgi:hypothetical protein